jgi:two-component system, chemotaxis family, sensor kinase CheA
MAKAPPRNTSPQASLGTIGKYRGLLALVTLFLVVVAAVAALNFTIARQLDQDAIGVNLSGRQRMLSQRTVKILLQLRARLELGEADTGPRQELALTVPLFDTTLRGFRDGATVTGGDGKPVFLAAATAGQERIQDALAIWEPYLALLRPLLATPANAAIDPAQLGTVLRYAEENNLKLLTQMNELTTALENQAKERAQLLRTIQLSAIGVAALLFTYIVFVSLRNLLKADAELLAAKAETDNILETVSDGLFLIDRDLRIGQQQSTALAGIFGQADLRGRTLPEVLSQLVPEETVATARTFIDLLFGERVKEALMGDVNPLKQVQITTTRPDGARESKYVAFKFRRVLAGGKLSQLLVSAADVTDEVELRQELERSRKRNEDQLALLTRLAHVGTDELASFLLKTQRGLDLVNEVLAQGGTSRLENLGKLAQISRTVHAIKGDAAALSFDLVERWAQGFEAVIRDLRSREQLTGNDLLPLTVQLRDIYQQLEGLRDFVARLGQMRTALAKTGGQPTRPPVWSKAQSLIERIAQRLGKKVRLHVRHDGTELPEAYEQEVSDALVQLVRNAVAHGIEPPTDRVAIAKPAEGNVWLSITQRPDRAFEISVQDDGSGFDLERIRAKAVALGELSPEQAVQADAGQLLPMIFRSGFTTATEVNEDAGQGVGMDVVDERVKSLGGKVALAFKAGQGSRVTLMLPSLA